MRAFRYAFRGPLPVLVFLSLAFLTWVIWDARSMTTKSVRSLPPGDADRATIEPVHGMPPRRHPLLPRPTPQETAQLLPRLKTGMSRTEVEWLVGAPLAPNIHPATQVDGSITYRTSYEADLNLLVRPDSLPSGTSTRVDLEYDATKPGHPLLAVYYPDPLF